MGEPEHRPLPVPVAIGWPFALAAIVYGATGRLGFVPADEGLILAQARRIAQGGVPHADVFSPRPLGSGLLHMPELWLPGPLLEVSRAISLIEIVAFSWVLAALAFRRGPARWSLAEAAGASAAVFVNLHTFPLMAWHTVDGILLVALGLAALWWSAADATQRLPRRASSAASGARLIRGALLAGVLFGAALLVKQSFAPAAALAFAWLVWRAGWRAALALAAGVALFPLSYAGWIAAAGGAAPLIEQLTSARPVFGQPFVTKFATPLGAFTWLACIGIGASAGWLAVRRERGDALRNASVLGLAFAIGLFIATSDLRYGARWGFPIVWMALAFGLGRRFAGAPFGDALLAVIALGWMTSLSWGHATPNLVVGSVALVVLAEALPGLASTGPPLRLNALGASALAGALLLSSVHERRQRPYYDRPAAALSAELRSVAPGFGGIRTNPITAAYLHEAKRCIATYPASKVAILPANAALYPLLDLDNPFPADWLFTHDVDAHHARFVEAARRLATRGDYLVLAQAIDVFLLRKQTRLPQAGERASWFEVRELGAKVAAVLPGRRVTCGPFAGIHAPRPRGEGS